MLKYIKNQRIDRNNALTVLGIASIVLYLILVNYGLPFLTMDGLVSATRSVPEQLEGLRLYGRSPSSYIGLLIAKFLEFQIPDIQGLTPRLFSMAFRMQSSSEIPPFL